LIIDTLADIDPAQWQALAGDNPTLSYTFLHALHETGCAAPRTGWSPRYLILQRDGAAAMPLYLKASRGEYVFDQGWADAFHRNGMPYYPKLLSAVPFTPVTGAACWRARPRTARCWRAALQVAQQLEPPRCTSCFPTTKTGRRWPRPATCCAKACSSTGRIRTTPISTPSSPA
jgi:predicted N-acyltransferase